LNLTTIKAVLQRNWRLFVAVLLFVPLIVAAPLFLLVRPTYEPVASVVIDPPGAETFSLETEIPNSEAENYLTTQTAILQSDALAIGVIRQLHLDRNPEIVGKDALKKAGDRPAISSGTQLTHLEDLALTTFQHKLTVSLFRNSQLVEVRFASHDPELAAVVTNTILNNFVDQNYRVRYSAITNSSEWLTKQLDDIRQKAEQSNQALADYESTIGFLDVDDKQNTLAQKMTEVSHQLSEAQADRIELGAYVDAVHQGDVDSVPELRNNELFHQLTEDYLESRAQLAEESAVFGKNNPKVKKLEGQAKQLRASLVHGVEASYESAKAREGSMARALQQMKGSINAQNEAVVKLNVLKREASANAELYNTLFTKVREAGISAASKSSNVRVVDYARILNRPTRPNRSLYLAVAIFLGLMASTILVLVREAFDDKLRSEDDVKHLTGLPSLGIIPKVLPSVRRSRLRSLAAADERQPLTFAADRPSSAESEAVQTLRTNILLAGSGKRPQLILVGSSGAQEGKTVIAANLAITLAKHGPTCLIDADMRRPQIAHVFGIPETPGLSGILGGSCHPDTTLRNPGVRGLSVIPAGERMFDVGELISSPLMQKLLEMLSARFEYVVIDSAPILPFSDARVLSTLVDGVILVGRYGETTQHSLQAAALALRSINAPMLGVVLNGMEHLPPYYSDYNPNAVEAAGV
jgi:capsular exopolysaccharide synthesis family protein